MLSILLHSSKTMRPANDQAVDYQAPALLHEAAEVAKFLQILTPEELQKSMNISAAMAVKTHALLQTWSSDPSLQRPAIDAFLGDIYSGLQVQSFTQDDRAYANKHLFILSGLYGILRALDSVYPYRLEMGYTLPAGAYSNLYRFWDNKLAAQIPEKAVIINLSAVEYTKAILPYLKTHQIIAPKFLTISPKTGEPIFVTVHAKIARGAFARWLIQHRISNPGDITQFNELGYAYSPALSSIDVPVFICNEFKGLGLSVRLT